MGDSPSVSLSGAGVPRTYRIISSWPCSAKDPLLRTSMHKQLSPAISVVPSMPMGPTMRTMLAAVQASDWAHWKHCQECEGV